MISIFRRGSSVEGLGVFFFVYGSTVMNNCVLLPFLNPPPLPSQHTHTVAYLPLPLLRSRHSSAHYPRT